MPQLIVVIKETTGVPRRIPRNKANQLTTTNNRQTTINNSTILPHFSDQNQGLKSAISRQREIVQRRMSARVVAIDAATTFVLQRSYAPDDAELTIPEKDMNTATFYRRRRSAPTRRMTPS
jgi:hypothetical protein